MTLTEKYNLVANRSAKAIMNPLTPNDVKHLVSDLSALLADIVYKIERLEGARDEGRKNNGGL